MLLSVTTHLVSILLFLPVSHTHGALLSDSGGRMGKLDFVTFQRVRCRKPLYSPVNFREDLGVGLLFPLLRFPTEIMMNLMVPLVIG